MDDGRQQMVAVKTLLARCAKDPEQIGSLRREYNICRKLADPRVIQAYAFGIDRGMPYLASEWFPALNLKRRIRSKEEREKIAPLIPKIIEEAAGGLGSVHKRGLGPPRHQAGQFSGGRRGAGQADRLWTDPPRPARLVGAALQPEIAAPGDAELHVPRADKMCPPGRALGRLQLWLHCARVDCWGPPIYGVDA